MTFSLLNPVPVSRGQLSSLVVRPVAHSEVPLWDRLMAQHHYLGLRTLVGASIRHVAILDGEWVGLLGWASAAYRCRARDSWIGWVSPVKSLGLKFVANNVRFLILPGERMANLASKTLSLSTKRLSADWQEFHGYPILLTETFVDPSRFAGTCYRAAGWQTLGLTSGYKKNDKKYEFHGERKLVFVTPLHKRAGRILANPILHPDSNPKDLQMTACTLTSSKADSLFVLFRRVSDVRSSLGKRHGLPTILMVAVAAVLSGRKDFKGIAEWIAACPQNILKRLYCWKNSKTGLYEPPRETTIRTVLQNCDVETIDKILGQWLYAQERDNTDAIAIDGKVLRGSGGSDGYQVKLVSALLHRGRTVIAQGEIHPASNEITSVAPLLKDMDIAGRVITLDAIHTQTETAKYVVEVKKADYMLTVKGNQPAMKKEIEDLNLEAFPPSAPNHRKGPWKD